MLLTPLPYHKLSHLLGPPPLERDVLYGRPHMENVWTTQNHLRSTAHGMSMAGLFNVARAIFCPPSICK